MTNIFVVVINVTMRFNSHEHVRRWITDQTIKFGEPFYVYGVIQYHGTSVITISCARFQVFMDDDMVYHPQVNMGENVGHLFFVVIINTSKQLMQVNDQNVIILIIFHALSSSEPKFLRMWDRTCEGMSIKFVASNFPFVKKYDCETQNILKQIDIKLTPLTR
jgi:hypothetical protein